MNTEKAASARLCVVLECFAGRKGAGRARGDVAERLRAHGELVDDVIVSVDGKHRARVHDPHRVVAGVLTPALTWGAFGLLAGGDVKGLVIWGVLGAVCGGLYAYGSEHLLAKNDLATIGSQLSADSSAVVAFVECDDDTALASAAPPSATVSSAVAIAPDLSSRAVGAVDRQVEPTALSMTLLRFDGEHGARPVVPSVDGDGTHVEMLVEVSADGHPRVVDPSHGVAAMSKSDVVSWGGFGVVFGFVAGFAGNGGIASALEGGIVTGIAWAVFGLVAGALFGLWAGRGTSARRIKGLRPLLPAGTSTAVIWVVGRSTDGIAEQIRTASRHVTLSFHPTERGAVLRTS
jgi:hypothetical protein